MTARVYTACRDCKNCTNSAFAHAGRRAGRTTALVLTAGVSEAAMATKKKCRQCGHQMSLHGLIDSLPPAAPQSPLPGHQPVAPPPPTFQAYQQPTSQYPVPPSTTAPQQPGFFKRSFETVRVFYTHPDAATRIRRRFVTALALAVFGLIGGIGNITTDLGAAAFGLAITVGALVWAARERLATKKLHENEIADRAERQHRSDDPDQRLYGDYPPAT